MTPALAAGTGVAHPSWHPEAPITSDSAINGPDDPLSVPVDDTVDIMKLPDYTPIGDYYGSDGSYLNIRGSGTFFNTNYSEGSIRRVVVDVPTQTGSWYLHDGKLHITLYNTKKVPTENGNYRYETDYSSVYHDADVSYYADVTGRHNIWLWGWVFVQFSWDRLENSHTNTPAGEYFGSDWSTLIICGGSDATSGDIYRYVPVTIINDCVAQVGTWSLHNGTLHISLYYANQVYDGWIPEYVPDYSRPYHDADVVYYTDAAGRHNIWLWGWVFVQSYWY